LDEHLDFNVTSKCVAQRAGRALCKCKAIGGVPYDVFKQIFG
jgi:hypothetical protein